VSNDVLQAPLRGVAVKTGFSKQITKGGNLMQKFIIAATVVLFGFMIALPATAADVKFSGEYFSAGLSTPLRRFPTTMTQQTVSCTCGSELKQNSHFPITLNSPPGSMLLKGCGVMRVQYLMMVMMMMRST
jgi:hypothetical protein